MPSPNIGLSEKPAVNRFRVTIKSIIIQYRPPGEDRLSRDSKTPVLRLQGAFNYVSSSS